VQLETTDPSVVAALAVPVAKPPPVLPDIEVKPEPPSPPPPADNGDTAPATPVPVDTGEMQPERARKQVRTIQKTKPTRRLQPGDLICGQCGEGNPPARKFCSRCGESLVTAEVVKRPWWRRLWPQKKVKTLEAGERPGKAGVKAKKKWGQESFRAFRKVIATAAIVFAAAFALIAPFRSWTNDTFVQPAKDKWNSFTTQTFDPVHPDHVLVDATMQTADHPGDLAVDGHGNTFWEAPPSPLGERVITLVFAQPVNLDRAIIQNGARDDFTNFSRAQKLHFAFNTGQSTDVELKDAPDPQKVTLHNGKGVTSVQIHIPTTYDALNNPNVAISEIELFTEK
jgi:hypothetical protein